VKVVPLLLLLVLLLPGCAARRSADGLDAYDGVTDSYPHATAEIASQAAGRLAAIYPPGRTTLRLISDEGGFGQALDASLRRHGFAVSADATTGIGLGYQLDMMPGEVNPTCYLRVRMSDGGAFNQIFSIRNGLVVAGSVTQTGLPNVAPVAAPAPQPVPAYEPSPVAAADALASSVAAAAPAVPPAPVVAVAPPAPVPSPAPIPTPAPVSSVPLPEAPLPVESASAPAMPAPTVTAPSPEPTAVGLQKVESEQWVIAPGSLKAQLEGWTTRAGYQLVWKAGNDFQMQSTAVFRDSFIGSVKRLVSRMHLNGNALRVTIYQENNVVEVTED
jgi:hypothetical protein